MPPAIYNRFHAYFPAGLTNNNRFTYLAMVREISIANSSACS